VPAGVDVGAYTTVVVWCEAFSKFISAAKYRVGSIWLDHGGTWLKPVTLAFHFKADILGKVGKGPLMGCCEP
jgi:hypothetical protein